MTPQASRALKTIINNNIINFIILNRYNYIILLFPPPQKKKKLSCLNKDYVCRNVCIYVRRYVYVVVQFHPWFKFCPFVLKLIIIH